MHVIKAGVRPKAVFWLGVMVLTQISRPRLKQSKINVSAHPTYEIS